MGGKLITDIEDINELYDFIRAYPLDYPDYMLWVRKCIDELKLGYKQAFVFRHKGKIVANLVFQQHKQDSSVLELKNGRIADGFKKKKIFSSIMKQLEGYAFEHGYKRIQADTHADNYEVLKTFEKLGFKIESHENLYSANLETILVKDLNKKNSIILNLSQLLTDLKLKLFNLIDQLAVWLELRLLC